jgi:hypothetical protein
MIICDTTDKVFGPLEQPKSAIARLLGSVSEKRIVMTSSLIDFVKEIAFSYNDIKMKIIITHL